MQPLDNLLDDDSALVMSIIENFLPQWAIGRASSFLEVGAQLPTRDGRRVGNAIVVAIQDREVERGNQKKIETFIEVVSDVGSSLMLTQGELAELFHEPVWIMDIETHPGVLRRKSRADNGESLLA